jgi:hypothetical protein
MNTDGTNGHLSAKDISRWLVEGPTAEAEAHVESCWNCQEKLGEAREPLTIFRATVVAWSEGQAAAQVKVGDRRKGLRGWNFVDWMPATSVAFALLVLAVFMVERGSWLRHPEAEIAHNPPAVSDAVLMEQVDQEVSEAVPDAMAPLTDLVAWDSGGATSEAITQKQVVKKKAATELHSKSRLHGTD